MVRSRNSDEARWLHDLFKGASISDIAWLADFDHLSSLVRRFDPATKSVLPVMDGEVPWPIVYLLGRFHGKHRWVSGNLPKIDRLLSAFNNNKNRLKWKWFFRHDNTPMPIRFRSRQVAPCTAVMPGEVAWWLGHTHDALHAGAREALARAKHQRRAWSNSFPLIRSAFKLMKNQWCALPADKEPGYILLKPDELRQAHLQILQSSFYREIGTLNFDFNRNLQQYFAKRTVFHKSFLLFQRTSILIHPGAVMAHSSIAR